MTKLITSLTVVLLGTNLNFAQVGIGTDNPQAMLEVNGTLLVQDTTRLVSPLKLDYIDDDDFTLTEFTGNEIVLVADLGDEEVVKKISLSNLALAISAELNIQNGYNSPNPTIFSAQTESSVSLLNLSLLSGGYKLITFPQSSHTVTSSAVTVSSTTFYYTAPSDGIYSIDFQLSVNTGLGIGLISNSQIGIFKQATGQQTATLLSSKNFPGATLGLVELAIAETQISSIYRLNQGDRIYLALSRNGLLNIDLLSSSKAAVNIMKLAGVPQ